jgi:hypothetical protein
LPWSGSCVACESLNISGMVVRRFQIKKRSHYSAIRQDSGSKKPFVRYEFRSAQ